MSQSASYPCIGTDVYTERVVLGPAACDATSPNRVDLERDDRGSLRSIRLVRHGVTKRVWRFSNRGKFTECTEKADDGVHHEILSVFANGPERPPTQVRFYLGSKKLSKRVENYDSGSPRRIEYFRSGTCYCREELEENGDLRSVTHLDQAGLPI